MHVIVRVFVSASVCAPALLAQERLTLQDAVSQAITANPQILAADARVSVAEGLRRQAGLGPNPRLVLQSENARFTGSPPFSYSRDADSYAFLVQTIETAAKRHRRVDLAAENVRRSEAEEHLQRQQIVTRVNSAYWAAVGAARTRDLLQQEASRFETVVQYHRDRVREGAAAEVDLIRIEVERDRLLTTAHTVALEAERARISLLREMGRTEFPVIEYAADLEQIRPVATIDLSQVLAKRAEMQIARQSIEQARANERLQRANGKPDPDVQLGYKRTSGFDTLYAAVQIPLPFRNRNQGLIEAAAAETTVSQAGLALAQSLIRAEIESAKKDYDLRGKLLEETLRPMRARTEEVYRIETAAYREGVSNTLRLLDAERSRIETLVMYTRALSEYQQSAAALEAAQGILP